MIFTVHVPGIEPGPLAVMSSRPSHLARRAIWSGCRAPPTVLRLPGPELFYTSFTLINGDRCGERSRLTSWTVTLPHLMHKRPLVCRGRFELPLNAFSTQRLCLLGYRHVHPRRIELRPHGLRSQRTATMLRVYVVMTFPHRRDLPVDRRDAKPSSPQERLEALSS
jgi:hypothetical protein